MRFCVEVFDMAVIGGTCGTEEDAFEEVDAVLVDETTGGILEGCEEEVAEVVGVW